jgi:ABC-2 type transport system permease protein
MWRVTWLEIKKIFFKGRSYIAFGAIALIIALIQLGLYVEGDFMIEIVMQNLKDQFSFQGNLLNGYLVSYVVLNTLWIHVPMLIAMVTGDMISGESGGGTFRLLLTRPVSRDRLLVAKFFASMVYATMMVIFIALISLLMGFLLFGTGDLLIMFNTLNIFPENDVLWRFLFAYGFGIVGMWVVAAFSFCLSVFSKNSLSPIITSIAVIIIFSILSTFQIGIFEKITPYLFTNYLNSWMMFFDFEVDYMKIGESVLVLMGHVLAFFLISFFVFRKKDITS